jgi:hypothetical protein
VIRRLSGFGHGGRSVIVVVGLFLVGALAACSAQTPTGQVVGSMKGCHSTIAGQSAAYQSHLFLRGLTILVTGQQRKDGEGDE